MIQNNDKRLSRAYEQMIERTATRLKDLKPTSLTLQQALEQTKNKAVELGELTLAEASQIAESIHQDYYDIARKFAENERDFADWIKLDILLIEEQLKNHVIRLVEVASQEIGHIVKQPAHPVEWHTGEITGIGILKCKSCGKKLHFHQPGHIPPCAHCQGTHFQRSWKND